MEMLFLSAPKPQVSGLYLAHRTHLDSYTFFTNHYGAFSSLYMDMGTSERRWGYRLCLHQALLKV